jgi:hypothetical protein
LLDRAAHIADIAAEAQKRFRHSVSPAGCA